MNRIKLAFLHLLLTVCTVLGDEKFPFVEKHDLDHSNRYGHATLTFDKPVIKTGQVLSAELRFFCRGMNSYYFNPFFNPLINKPAQIAVYDANRKYINKIDHLYKEIGGSHLEPSVEDWVYIQNGCSVGKALSISIPELPPGDYYLQVIYYNAFLTPNPWKAGARDQHEAMAMLQRFSKGFDNRELFRSNPVKITITK